MADDDNYTPGSSLGETITQTISPYAERIIKYMINSIADQRPIAAFIRDLDPEVIMTIHQTLPGVGGFLSTKIPDGAFKTAERAMLARELVREATRGIADTLKAKKDATEAELMAVVEAKIAEVENRLVIVDQMDHFHLANCAKARRAAGGSARRGRNQQGPAANELTFKEAIEQGLAPAACCYTRVEEAKSEMAGNKHGKATATKGRSLSPLDVIGDADPELRKRFVDWLEGLEQHTRAEAMEGLHELDSHEEFVGFMELSPKLRLEMLPLLKNRNAKHTFKRWLGILGGVVMTGAKELVTHAKRSWASYQQWDRQFAQKADEVRRQRSVPVAERVRQKQARKKPVPWSFKSMFWPF